MTSELAARIANVQEMSKAIRMVINHRQSFYLAKENGDLAEALTAGRRIKLYRNHDHALQRAIQIIRES